MPWPVYTERLLSTSVPNVWATATVPAGQRAIVKSVVSLNSSQTVPLTTHVTIASGYAAAFVIPDYYNAKSLDLLAVAYAGEEIRAYLQGQSGFVLVTGWLLEDPSGRDRSPLERSFQRELAPPAPSLGPFPADLE